MEGSGVEGSRAMIPRTREHAALLRSPSMGARICPGCATRVDERRAKTSPYCLRCGAPLGPPAPSDGGRSGTFAGKQPGAAGGSIMPWILGGIALVVLLGVGGVIALIAVVASNAEPDPAASPAAAANQPKVEAPSTATAAPSAGTPASAIAVKAPVPTVRPTATVTARPTTPPVPTPPPFPTAPPTATATGTGSGGVVALGPFNRSRAQSEVDRVGATLSSCSRSSGPFGAGSIRIDFEPDGRVGTLSRPPFAGTAVGSCISARFLSIRIGPFNGSTQNIEKAFIIQQ